MTPQCVACGGYLLPCTATSTGIHPGYEGREFHVTVQEASVRETVYRVFVPSHITDPDDVTDYINATDFRDEIILSANTLSSHWEIIDTKAAS